MVNTRKHRFDALGFALLSIVALALLAGAGSTPVYARDYTFKGVAGLCALDRTGVTQETKGGITFEYGLKFYYRIETDHPLINGWETLISNTRRNPAEQEFYFGNATLEPDIARGSTLEGKFFFPADANPIKGNYFGTGDLEKVVVHYELFPDPTVASTYATLCDGSPPLFGYLMYGSVKNYEEN